MKEKQDENIYSSSALVHLLAIQYRLNVIDLADILDIPMEDVCAIRDGIETLGEDNYKNLQLKYPNLPRCDYDGSYSNQL